MALRTGADGLAVRATAVGTILVVFEVLVSIEHVFHHDRLQSGHPKMRARIPRWGFHAAQLAQ